MVERADQFFRDSFRGESNTDALSTHCECWLCAVCAVGLAAEKPNVLFLAVDDMNDWIGCLDSVPQAITPNLNRLAARGELHQCPYGRGVLCTKPGCNFLWSFASTTGCYRNPCYFVDHPEIEPLQLSFAKAGYQTLVQASSIIMVQEQLTLVVGLSFSFGMIGSGRQGGRSIHGQKTHRSRSHFLIASTTRAMRFLADCFLSGVLFQKVASNQWLIPRVTWAVKNLERAT